MYILGVFVEAGEIVRDQVVCYKCGQTFRQWELTDDPIEEHKRIFIDCFKVRITLYIVAMMAIAIIRMSERKHKSTCCSYYCKFMDINFHEGLNTSHYPKSKLIAMAKIYNFQNLFHLDPY